MLSLLVYIQDVVVYILHLRVSLIRCWAASYTIVCISWLAVSNIGTSVECRAVYTRH